jgi:uncharacterized membrane-anchored protein YhcB (DUF1043 family)
MNWLKENWIILSAIGAAGVAWGAQQVKIQNLEQVVTQQAPVNTKLQEQSARVDERTKEIQDTLAQQQKLLLMLLQKKSKNESYQ